MDFASQILYNAMAATMAPIFCIELNLYRKEINGQGPCLLHYVFMWEKVHSDTSKQMNNLDSFQGISL